MVVLQSTLVKSKYHLPFMNILCTVTSLNLFLIISIYTFYRKPDLINHFQIMLNLQ